MSEACNGVIEDATGDLLRAGYTTFTPEVGETVREDVPFPPKVRGDKNHANMHRWSGSAWVEVANVFPTSIRFHAASKLIEDEKSITENTDWQCAGGVISSPDFFTPNIAAVFGRLTVGAKVAGTGAELKVTEDNGVSVVDISPVTAIADTSGAWATVQFNTNVVPRAGANTYCLMARKNGATSMDLRFGSMSLLEVM